MSSIDIRTLEIINGDLDAHAIHHYFAGRGSLLTKRETLNVKNESKSSKDKVKSKFHMVGERKQRSKKGNAKGLPKRLLKKEPEIEANQTEHFKQFEKNLHFVCMWGILLGLKLDYQWKKNNPKFWFTSLFIMYTWFNILYTQYLHINHGDFKGLLEVFSLYGIGFAAIMVNWVNFRNYKKITALMHFTRKICLQNVTGSRADVLKSGLMKIHKILIFVGCAAVLCVVVYMGYPLQAFLFDGELISIMPIEIMFIDQSTLSGFLIANVIMSIMGLWTVSFLLFANLSFFTVVLNYTIHVSMIEEDIKELGECQQGYQILLRNICQKQQDMKSYLNAIKEIYETPMFVFFCISYVSQIICLFQIVTNKWISGYGIAFGILLCHMGYCCVGTVIISENERLRSILVQFKWYNCDLRSKKIYLQLLTLSMDTQQLWIGPLAPLNLITGIQIVKSIYSYYTLLMQLA